MFDFKLWPLKNQKKPRKPQVATPESAMAYGVMCEWAGVAPRPNFRGVITKKELVAFADKASGELLKKVLL
jgi:hypothetical protein